MADYHQPREEASYGYGGQHQISGWTVIYASLAGLAFGGPLLAMAGFSFLASVTISWLLLLIFSPLLFGACAVLVAAFAGFGMAAVAGLDGLSSFVFPPDF
ncbi:LOW QUALITY PROTEIN: hypothetical protein PanWU01x14_246080 [Parasponia andersonii]|uniref:Oleosin n=1 Tax=Parasponia andersonii TaxID=3476 RepID=A0A2P5BEL8_PARAD|nr:LOW QUALITY PROTEIN: hypothetical protein PanWU01x14_246080 [Parasponia andersonii]